MAVHGLFELNNSEGFFKNVSRFNLFSKIGMLFGHDYQAFIEETILKVKNSDSQNWNIHSENCLFAVILTLFPYKSFGNG